MTEPTGTWHRAAALEDIAPDEPLGVEIAGLPIALFRIGDAFYATGNLCTHELALLSDGFLDGCTIECPLHNGRFDVRTGEALSSPVEVDLPIYEVRVAGDALEILLPP